MYMKGYNNAGVAEICQVGFFSSQILQTTNKLRFHFALDLWIRVEASLSPWMPCATILGVCMVHMQVNATFSYFDLTALHSYMWVHTLTNHRCRMAGRERVCVWDTSGLMLLTQGAVLRYNHSCICKCLTSLFLGQARTSWDRESTEMRYKRLQHLLEKSNIYSKFLLTKMEQQQLEVGVFLSAVGILKMLSVWVFFHPAV